MLVFTSERFFEESVLRRIIFWVFWQIHRGVLLAAFCACALARRFKLIPIGDERYELIRPEDMRISVIGFSASIYLGLVVFLPVLVFCGPDPIFFSPLAFFPPTFFFFTAIICRMVLESELREAIREKKEKKDFLDRLK